MRTAATPITEYTLRDDGIVVGRDVDTPIHRDTAMVTESMDALAELTGGKLSPGLWDPRALTRVYPEGWVVLIQRLPDLLSALAILVNDELESLLGAFPGLMDSMLFPVRMFRDETEALDWLAQFLE
ncbi:MAG: hypothetical protein QNJ89_09810 [Acidimicrobiia bacterium]|nr:hypothetical protein [Acidimicrobiia bacterium]